MSRYTLTPRIYHTMVGRGYKLVCKICEMALQVLPPTIDVDSKEAREFDVESKPSKYRTWQCDECGRKHEQPPRKKVLVMNQWHYVCYCGGILYNIGRKFYHATCYDNSHYGSSLGKAMRDVQ